MKKKALASLLAVALAATSLVACGSSEKTGTTDEVKTESTAETTVAESTAESTGDSAEADPVANLIAATTDTVTLTVWASEEDQELTTTLIENF